MFEKNIYVQRRKVLKEKIDSGIILFLGNDESPMNYTDNTYPFRQHSSFLYYFGIDRPSLAAIIDLDSGEETIFGEEQTLDEIVWMGNMPSLQSDCEKIGIKNVLPIVKLYTVLREANASGRSIHFLTPYRSENKIKLLRLLNIRPDQFSNKSSEELTKVVVSQREIKSAIEIEEMHRATDISVDMHVAAMKMARPGMTEADITAEVSAIPLRHNGQISFPVIATVHGEILHNHYHGNKLKEGQLFLLDAGAETPMHYAGDLSSTFPVSRKFTKKQKNIYQLQLNAHKAAVNMLRPGVKFKDVHFEAARTIFNGLKDLGLTKGDTETALAEGAHALFWQTGLGHMIGLDVHDMEDLGEVNVGYNGEPKSTQFGLKSLRLAKELKPGFAITIEPGIYFIPELINLWKSENKFSEFINYSEVMKYYDFGGIRNEEDYLITADGYERIGKYKPMEIDEVEALRAY